MVENLYQGKEGSQTDLMVFGGDAELQLIKARRPPTCLDDGTRYGDLDTQELIAFSVLPGAAFEKPAQAFYLGRIGRSSHFII